MMYQVVQLLAGKRTCLHLYYEHVYDFHLDYPDANIHVFGWIIYTNYKIV